VNQKITLNLSVNGPKIYEKLASVVSAALTEVQGICFIPISKKDYAESTLAY
jgi:hypothetical protein